MVVGCEDRGWMNVSSSRHCISGVETSGSSSASRDLMRYIVVTVAIYEIKIFVKMCHIYAFTSFLGLF